MIGARHSVVCGRTSLVKVSVEWVIWLTVFEQRVPEEEELISHNFPSLCIRRLAVLDRKLRGAKFSSNFKLSNGNYGLHDLPMTEPRLGIMRLALMLT